MGEGADGHRKQWASEPVGAAEKRCESYENPVCTGQFND